jgi:hypothetical protein
MVVSLSEDEYVVTLRVRTGVPHRAIDVSADTNMVQTM